MRNLLSLFVPGMALAMCLGALAQGPTYNVGRPASQDEIRAWDIDVMPDGTGLPPGSGTVAQGTAIFAVKCAKCHGATGEKTPSSVAGGTGLVRRTGPNNTPRPLWQYSTIIWDQINKAMPRYEEGSLTPNEVYSLTALILYWNGVIQASDVMDRETLPKVQMPNRNGFIPLRPDWKWYQACNPNLRRCADTLSTR
jgi:mono/diheme cytochrome c family protein